MLLPFLPLVAELVVLGQIEKKTMLLFMAIYLVSLGVSSHSRLMFGATVIVGFLYSMFFGLAAAGASVSESLLRYGYWILFLGMALHVLERYHRHVVRRHLFWDFSGEVQS